jgi:hypothetical protein
MKTSPYRVQVAPRPIVIDAFGVPIVAASVIEISFPVETIGTRTGPMNVIVGAGIAKITVSGEIVRGVPIC